MDLESHICGGYFLARRTPRPKAISTLAAENLITLSSCFTVIAPDTWAIEGYNYSADERAQEAAKFGIPPESVPSLVSEITSSSGRLPANAFVSLSIARKFFDASDKQEVVLLGIGLSPLLKESLNSQIEDDVNHGYGLIEFLDRSENLEAGGHPLGYEPLGFCATKFHSWLCHNGPEEIARELGIRPNRDGFIDDFGEAVRATEFLKRTGAETAIWEPWLVVRYGADDRASSSLRSSE